MIACVCFDVVYLCKIISRLVCNFVCLYMSVWSLYCKQMASLLVYHLNYHFFYCYYFYFFIETDVCCLKMSFGWAGGLCSRAQTMNAVLAKGKIQFSYCSMTLFGKFKDFHMHLSYVYENYTEYSQIKSKRKISVAFSTRLRNGFRSLPYRRYIILGI